MKEKNSHIYNNGDKDSIPEPTQLIRSLLCTKFWKIYKYYISLNSIMTNKNNPAPGDGLRSVRTTSLFRVVNFELYTKPNAVIMGLGLIAIAGCAGYIAYMRSKYEGLGYYGAIREDGKEEFVKRKSKWD